MRVELKPIFQRGDEVIEREGGKRIGVIGKVWTKPIKITDTVFDFEISYSVYRDKGYNQFRAKENNLRAVAYDEEGNLHVMPKGVTTRH